MALLSHRPCSRFPRAAALVPLPSRSGFAAPPAARPPPRDTPLRALWDPEGTRTPRAPAKGHSALQGKQATV